MNRDDLLEELKKRANPAIAAGKARFGIKSDGIKSRDMLGILIPDLFSMAKKIGANHDLAIELWHSGIHEARILACMIDEPEKVSEKQMEQWAGEFDSWDICDQCCNRLFRKTDHAWKKMAEWTERDEEYVKRAGFALIAQLAVHDKAVGDDAFESLFPMICREATDDRNFVKKSVNWSLRQIGKRNLRLNRQAVEICEKILEMDSKTARWIANDALRELTGEKVLNRLSRSSS